jgi:hypothetical protein
LLSTCECNHASPDRAGIAERLSASSLALLSGHACTLAANRVENIRLGTSPEAGQSIDSEYLTAVRDRCRWRHPVIILAERSMNRPVARNQVEVSVRNGSEEQRLARSRFSDLDFVSIVADLDDVADRALCGAIGPMLIAPETDFE